MNNLFSNKKLRNLFVDFKYEWLAFGLALLAVTIIFVMQGLTPFGKQNLLISDMGTQYLSFFTNIYHAVETHNFQLYSFSQSLGGNLLPLIAYYLLSPFNIIMFLSPSAADIPMMLSLIIMLKIATIAATMTYFLQQHFRQQSWQSAVFGLMFALSGFVVVYFFNIMWLDALVWLPLIINGLDKLIDTGKTGSFFGWLTISILTDFYLGYMTCWFALFYFGYRFFAAKQADQLTFWQASSRFVATGIFSVASATVVLWPTFLGMLQTAKTQNNWHNFLLVPEFGLRFFSQLAVGATSYQQRLQHAPTIFCSTLAIVLLGSFLLDRRISRKLRQRSGICLLLLLATLWLRLTNTIWHLGQKPAGFVFRNAFFVSFFIIMLAYQGWQNNAFQHLSRKRRNFLLGTYLLLLIIGWLADQQKSLAKIATWASGNAIILPTNFIASLSILLISLGLVLLVTQLLRFRPQSRIKTWVLGLTIIELMFNFNLYLARIPFGNQKNYQFAYQLENKQLQNLTRSSRVLFRIDNQNTLINTAYREPYNNYNDPMLFGFHDINYYSSTLNNSVRKTLYSLGLFSHNQRRISSFGLTRVTDLLLGIKFSAKFSPENQPVESQSGFIGMGFSVPSRFLKLQLQQKNFSALNNQEKILQALHQQNSHYFKTVKVLKSKDSRTLQSHYIYQHAITLQAKQTGPVYLENLTRNGLDYASIKIDNHRIIHTDENLDGFRSIQYLGTFKAGQKFKLTFTAADAAILQKLQIKSLDATAFNQLRSQLSQTAVQLHYRPNGWKTELTAQTKPRKHGYWLYLAIPADSGWTASNGQQKLKIERALGSMMVVRVPKNTTRISLTYHVPGLVIAAWLSISAVVFYLIWAKFAGQQLRQSRDASLNTLKKKK